MWPNIALLVALLAPVQNSSQPQTAYQLGSGPAPLFQTLQIQTPGQPGAVPQFQQLPRMFSQRRFEVPAIETSNMCFAIRSYIFKRNDSKAPVLVKTMTCTPNTVFLEKAGPPHKARLVPAN